MEIKIGYRFLIYKSKCIAYKGWEGDKLVGLDTPEVFKQLDNEKIEIDAKKLLNLCTSLLKDFHHFEKDEIVKPLQIVVRVSEKSQSSNAKVKIKFLDKYILRGDSKIIDLKALKAEFRSMNK